MICLLDTHAALWAATAPSRLGRTARGLIEDPNNDILVSVVSFWEVSLKFALGKLVLEGFSPQEFPAVCARLKFEVCELSAEDASSFHLLPRTGSKDPFGRMLVWQSIRRQAPLISADGALREYQGAGLQLIW